MSDDQVLVRVAWLYYMEGLTQDRIASRLRLTRLRVNRLLASFAQQVDSEDRFAAWVERMSALDRRARRFELENLPAKERAGLERSVSGGIEPVLERCGDLLTSRDLASTARRTTLREKARVPDDYDTWKRVIGLYWITRIPFASGVRRYQDETQAVFDRPVADLPVRGRHLAHPRKKAVETGDRLHRADRVAEEEDGRRRAEAPLEPGEVGGEAPVARGEERHAARPRRPTS